MSQINERKGDYTNTESGSANIDEGKLIGGCTMVGVAIWEFSTSYFADNYLIPYQETGVLRSVFESGIAEIIISLWGLKMAYFAIKPYLDKKVIAYLDKKDL